MRAAVLAVVALLVAAPAASAGGGGVRVERGIEYGTAEVSAPAPGRVPLLLDLYRPPRGTPRPWPVVVVIHGGGFTMQSRTDDGIVRIARGLAARGIAAASIDYRLLDQQPVAAPRVATVVAAEPLAGPLFTTMATAVDDTLSAFGYLRRHARQLHLDIDRMGIVGSSAGAITANTVAYALDDLGVRGPALRFVGSLWGGIYAAEPPDTADPAVQLGAGEPALFAVHGDADTLEPVAQSDALVARATAVGVPVEYHRIPGGEHGYALSRFFTEPVHGGTPFERLLAFAAQQLSRG